MWTARSAVNSDDPTADQEPRFSVHRRRVDSACVITVRGQLDLAAHDTLDQELREAEAGDAERILLDLTETTFMDSTGIKLLVEATERSRARAKRLRVSPVQGQVRHVLELTGVLDRLDFDGG